MIGFLLAAATAIQVGTAFFVIVALMGALLLGTKLKKEWWPDEKNKPVTLSNKPLEVRLEEQFPTRREFERLEDDVREVQKELPKMERRIIEEVKDGLKDIKEEIHSFGSAAHTGRGKIWKELNEVRERVSAVESKTNGL